MKREKNKRKLTKAICLMCMASLAVPVTIQNTNIINVMAAEEIEWNELETIFPDYRVCWQVKEALNSNGFSEGDPITQEALDSIDYLYINEAGYEDDGYDCDIEGDIDLTGIDRLSGITSLWITGNVKSLELVNSLKNLGHLTIEENDNIVSLEEISGVTSLLEVDLTRCNNLTSLKGLENNTNLKEFDAYYCVELSDISVCANFENLEVVSLKWCESITDISALKDKTTIKRLDLGYTNVVTTNKSANCEVLKSLTGIRILQFIGGKVDDEALEYICSMTNLEVLVLNGNYITDISSITKLTNLETLDICDNKICDFSPLASLNNLTEHEYYTIGIDFQYINFDGTERTIENPFVGMDGKPIVPKESDLWSYDSLNNTITFLGSSDDYPDGAFGTWTELAVAEMDYNGTTFDMKLYISKNIEDAITITKQPGDVNCTEGDEVTLSVEAESYDDNFTYTWYKDDEVIADVNSSMLTLSKAELSNAGEYKCVISNATSSATSATAIVSVDKKEGVTTEEATTEETTTEEVTTEEVTTGKATNEEITTQETLVETPTTEENTTAATTEENLDNAVATGDNFAMTAILIIMSGAFVSMLVVSKRFDA